MLIAQVSDTHITVDGGQARDLGAALAWIGAMQPQPDVVVVSGDMAHNGRPDQYARLRDILAGCSIDAYVVPGNHDRRPALRAMLPARRYPGVIGAHLTYAVDSTPVRIIALDTTRPGRPGGILDAADLARLDDLLSAAPDRPALLFMHHPPFRTGVTLADLLGFKGLHNFERLVARHRQLRRIVAGHIHCERSATIAQAHVSTSLSTTPQLVPELFERRVLGLRPEPAGFAIHAWQNDTFTSTTYVQTSGGSFEKRSPDQTRIAANRNRT